MTESAQFEIGGLRGREAAVIQKPFGSENRARLIKLYFSDRGQPTYEGAWLHVYRMLLWVDQTIGLAHCYESDKSQPGRPWYARSLAFHAWLSTAFGIEPTALGEEIDWLFRRAVADLTNIIVRHQNARAKKVERQRQAYPTLPMPGEDPELTQIIREVLGRNLTQDVPENTWRVLAQRIRQHLGLENKRKNLVGEGFEDVIAATLTALPGVHQLDVSTRQLLHGMPGFNRARAGDKPNKVDVAVVNRETGVRTLVTAKWSIRADREKQFTTDYADYIAAESARQPFNYVLVTNEFDLARLMRACEALAGNAHMFTHVVHINPEAVCASYGETDERAARKVLEYIAHGRLRSFGVWAASLAQTPG